MKMIRLSQKILSHMVKEYKKSEKTHFAFTDVKTIFPGFTDKYLCDAIYLLNNIGYVKVLCADNVAYITILLPEGIRYCETNTWVSKCYSVLKEIKSFFQ